MASIRYVLARPRPPAPEFLRKPFMLDTDQMAIYIKVLRVDAYGLQRLRDMCGTNLRNERPVDYIPLTHELPTTAPEVYEDILARIAYSQARFAFHVLDPFTTRPKYSMKNKPRTAIAFEVSSQSLTELCGRVSTELKVVVDPERPSVPINVSDIVAPRIPLARNLHDAKSRLALQRAMENYKHGIGTVNAIGLALRIIPGMEDPRYPSVDPYTDFLFMKGS